MSAVSTRADKLRLAIRYNDNSRRLVDPSLTGNLDGVDGHYDAIDQQLRAELAGLDGLLTEMEAA